MKEKFIKSTIILLIGGFLTKILGMIIKIVMSRMIGTEGLGLYMLILPTFSLFIGIAQFGMPIAFSKLIAEDNKNNKLLFTSILSIVFIINIVIIVIILLIAPYLSAYLLHEKRVYLAILAMAIVVPFTTLSSICRSYFFGVERMFPHVFSNIVEDIVRLFLMVFGINFFLRKGIEYAVCFIILSNVISEGVSILILLLFLPKKITFKKKELIPNKSYIKELLSIGVYNTTGRLIGSFGYFLEPIILTSTLLFVGYSSNFITREYGIISGYVIPILLLPSFFTMAISQALLPVVSKEYSKRNIASVKKKIRLAVVISLLIGIPATILFVLFPKLFLKFIYNTTEGVSYMRFLAPVCLLQYIQAPLSFSLDAMGYSKDNMIATLFGVFVRTIFLFLLSLMKIGIWGLIISTSLNIIVVTFLNIKKVRSHLT